MDITYNFQVSATMVANEFIDRYMANANGEYVKVYLYILRHKDEPPSLEKVAEDLNHTEADVRRALAYWEKMGALECVSKKELVQERAGADFAESQGVPAATRQNQVSQAMSPEQKAAQTVSRSECSSEQLERLQGDGDFSQLLYIAQRYLGKIFTPRDVEVFAYLYDGLRLPMELLEYLVEYCAQNNHTSVRYVEKVAMDWHEKGFGTVEEAKEYTSGFTKNSFSVMRAFGLTGRNPGDVEKEMIERWFNEYGFTKELVLEACRRTLQATHNPSFRYADRILSDWRKVGVKSLKDVSALDEKHKGQKRPVQQAGYRRPNQFHNFEQRGTDYDSIMLQQVKEWIGER